MYIGKLAKLSGATPKAIRLYESIGLIPTPKRQGRYRVYSDKDVSLVHMIRRAQAVGFSLLYAPKRPSIIRKSAHQSPDQVYRTASATKKQSLAHSCARLVHL